MPDSLTNLENAKLSDALARVGQNEQLREIIFEILRRAETQADIVDTFRHEVRLPIIRSLLRDAKTHRVVLENGLIFEVGFDSRIEQALLLSSNTHPDHVWEPQTTKLLVALAADVLHVIVGGAYIGDQALLIARAMMERNLGGMVHTFEPMEHAFNRLLYHLELNGITNVLAHRLALWEKRDIALSVEGPAALASSLPVSEIQSAPKVVVQSKTIDDYVDLRRLSSVGLIMLDIEGWTGWRPTPCRMILPANGWQRHGWRINWRCCNTRLDRREAPRASC